MKQWLLFRKQKKVQQLVVPCDRTIIFSRARLRSVTLRYIQGDRDFPLVIAESHPPLWFFIWGTSVQVSIFLTPLTCTSAGNLFGPFLLLDLVT